MFKFFANIKKILADLQLILQVLNEIVGHLPTENPVKMKLMKRVQDGK